MCNESFTPAHITLNTLDNLKKSVCSNLFVVGQPPFFRKSLSVFTATGKKCGFAADPPPQKCVEMASQARVKGADVAGP